MKVETQIIKIIDGGIRTSIQFYQCKCGKTYHAGLDMIPCKECGYIPQVPIFITIDAKEVN